MMNPAKSLSVEPSLAALRRARAFLAAQQNADGGWGYRSGGQSFAEPTCYALLALSEPTDMASETRVSHPHEARALSWFDARRNPAGAITLGGGPAYPDNWGTILTCFTLNRLHIGQDLNQQHLRYLLAARGNRISPLAAEPLRLDGSLQAWSWAQGTASWVEPTAYALLALKAHGMRAHERVQIGERYLLDRACYEGGWNYGNKEVLEVKLEPMPTNTAFALLALQDFQRDHIIIRQSLAYFEKEVAERQSTLTLSLGILSLDIYDRPVDSLLTALTARQEANGSWRDNVHLTGLAALALALKAEQRNIFRIQAAALKPEV